MKYLLPLTRANAAGCLRLIDVIASHRLTTRQIGAFYQVYLNGPDTTRGAAHQSLARPAPQRRRAGPPRRVHAGGVDHRPLPLYRALTVDLLLR